MGLFPCYVFLAKSWTVVSVLNFTIMLNNSSVLSSMAFCEIASALHSCYLLMPLAKTWTKIFKQKLSTWTWLRLSIPLISKLCFKSSNDMVRKAYASLVYRLPKWRIWKVLSYNGPRLHRKFPQGSLLGPVLSTGYCVCVRRRIWV